MASACPMQRITEMLQVLQDIGEIDTVSSLYSDWNQLVTRDDISISLDLRSKYDHWFLKCYQTCEEDGKVMQQENLDILKQDIDEKLCEDLKELIRTDIDGQIEFPDKLKLQLELTKLEHIQASAWIKRAHLCVREEQKLMDSYNKTLTDTSYISSKKPCEKEYEKVQGKKKILLERLDHLEFLVKEHQDTHQRYEQKRTVLEDTSLILQGLQAAALPMPESNMNGLHRRNHQQETERQQIETDLANKLQNFKVTVQDVYYKFEDVYQGLYEVTECLYQEVQHWQCQLKLAYVELKATVDLEAFAPWCAKTGQLIQEMICRELPRLRHAIQSVAGLGTDDCNGALLLYNAQNNKFTYLLNSFFQRTFVVAEQESWCVKKKDKTQIPKVTLRILGADHLEILGNATVKAYFVLEDNIKDDWFTETDGCLQLDVRKIKGQTLKHDTEKFIKLKKDQRYEGKFSNIQLTFDRGTRQKLVHEEKYRLIFYTKLDNKGYWTLSLPMVVTTGANQNCQCLASVMWQCYSTDVFAVPIETKTELPWSTVAEMLNTKMKKLTTRRILTPENLRHLRHRIPEQSSEEDDPMITLSQFCNDKLDKDSANIGDDDKCLFSFWKWFLAIYNLIEKYLLKYWENGWIEGFISKSEAERKLKEASRYRSPMYLLRFSDSSITDSQGLKSVFGLVTAAVLMVKKTKDNQKAKTVHHMDVAGHNKLKDKPLANILLSTEDTKHNKFYQYLYPSLTPSEQLFSQLSSSDPVVPGYTGVRDAFIVDLEQALQKLEITGKRMSSSSSGSEDQDGFPDMKSPSLAGSKKIKRDSTETRPSCQGLANSPSACGSGGSNASSPMQQGPSSATSPDCPTLRNLLTKTPKQQPVSVNPLPVLQGSPSSFIPAIGSTNDIIPPCSNTSQSSCIPTFLSESNDASNPNGHQGTQNTFAAPDSSYPGAANVQLVDPNTDMSQFGSEQHQWSQNGFSAEAQNLGFMTMLSQTEDISGDNHSDLLQNPQFAWNSTTAGNQPASVEDVAGNQHVPFYGNIGTQMDGTEQHDPSVTQMPQVLDDEMIVNLFIQHIIPKLALEEKEKILTMLQSNASPLIETPNLEEPTSDDMVTSSSSGPMLLNSSQLNEQVLQSDSGSVAKNMDVFDRFDLNEDVSSY